ncbi:hypothetical protein BC831DRAFT_509408, partial [Entophlyctis helioformis]
HENSGAVSPVLSLSLPPPAPMPPRTRASTVLAVVLDTEAADTGAAERVCEKLGMEPCGSRLLPSVPAVSPISPMSPGASGASVHGLHLPAVQRRYRAWSISQSEFMDLWMDD